MIRAVFAVVLLAFATQASAVSTPFSFQGTLEDAGVAANGSYDLQFVMKTATGVALSAPITVEDVPVVGGVFTVQLDFGNGFFTGPDRRLGMSVRAGTSSGAFTALSPDLPMNAAPYAQLSNDALTAAVADDVIDFAIDSIDINSAAVTTEKLQNDAVTADKLASNSVSIASFTGGSGSGSISYSIGANDCDEGNITFGGVAVGDFVILNTDPLPDDVMIVAMSAPAVNTVRIKICNVGTATQAFTNLAVRFISFR